MSNDGHKLLTTLSEDYEVIQWWKDMHKEELKRKKDMADILAELNRWKIIEEVEVADIGGLFFDDDDY